MAHKKAGASTSLGRDSNAQRLGVKVYGGQIVKAGGIIIRQRGTKYRAGLNVMQGKDDTLFSKIAGTVQFKARKIKKFTGKLEKVTTVNVLPLAK